ncbi:MAG: SDR family oxidoreductase [Magnetococcales bacterium]|nr:SDR family oxidoreductase [Magnetococcales bacterium]
MNSFLSNLFSLEGRSALVVGGSRGIGAALAVGLSKAGATVTATGRSPQASGLDESVIYCSCDATKENQVKGVIQEIVERSKTLDILVYAAGIARPTQGDGQQLSGFSQIIDINLKGAYLCNLLASQQMAAGSGGSIINVTSIGAYQGFPNNPAYSASKGGLRIMSKSLAMDFANDGIRINNLAPGYIRTEMTEGSYKDPFRRQKRVERMITPRWGQPDDLVGATIFLASDASSYITGQDILVDGGWTAKGLS